MRRSVPLTPALLLLLIATASPQTPDRTKLAEGSYLLKGPAAKGRSTHPAVADRWTLWRTLDGYELETQIAPQDVRPPDDFRSRTRFDRAFQVVEYALNLKRGDQHLDLDCKASASAMTCTLGNSSASLAVQPPYVLVLEDEAALVMDFPWLIQNAAVALKKRNLPLQQLVVGEDDDDPSKPVLRLESEKVPGYVGEEDLTWNGKKIRVSKVDLGESTFAYLAPSGLLLAVSDNEGILKFELADYKEEEDFLLRR
jgi:hypothetical protein